MAKPNFVDQRFILIEHDEYIKAEKADGSVGELIKLGPDGKPEFPVVPKVGSDLVALDSGVDAKILVEKQRAETAEGQLASDLATEVSARQSGDAGLQAQINALSGSSGSSLASEEAARIAGDASLGGRIDSLESEVESEVSRAQAAEGVLDGKITQEISDRKAAISGVESALASEVSGLEGAISGEASARQAADQSLDGKIEVEKGRIDAILLASDADKDSFAEIVQLINSVDISNDNSLASAVTAINSSVAEVASDLSAEVARATGVEQDLQSQIWQETTNRIESVLAESQARQNGISVEAQARVVADQLLSEAIQQISVDRVGGDLQLSNALLEETQNRTSADNTLDEKITNEISARQEGDTSTLSSANAYTDERISGLPFSYYIGKYEAMARFQEEESARIAADQVLDGKIQTEKDRVDAILLASEADKDSFSEIVSLINQIDTSNDSAFGTYVTSNNAAVAELDGRLDVVEPKVSTLESGLASEISARTSADSSLQTQINQEVASRQSAIASEQSRAMSAESSLQTSINSEATSRQSADSALDVRIKSLEDAPVLALVEDEKHNVGSTVSHVMLDYKAEKIFKVCVGRMNAMKGEDYTVSEVNGKTKLTFIGSFAQGGDEAVAVNEDVFCTYSTLNLVSDGGTSGGGASGGGTSGGSNSSLTFSSELKSSSITLSNGSLTAERTSDSGGYVSALLGSHFELSGSQKIYFEMTVDNSAGLTNLNAFGFVFQTGVPSTFTSSSVTIPGFYGGEGPRVLVQGDYIYKQGPGPGAIGQGSFGGLISSGSVCGIAVDIAAKTFFFVRNGVQSASFSFADIINNSTRIYLAVGPAAVGTKFTKNTTSLNTPSGYTLI